VGANPSIGSEEPVVCCSTASDRPDWIVLLPPPWEGWGQELM